MAVGLVGNAVGFLLALWLDQPPGPVLVVTVAVLALATYLPRPEPLTKLKGMRT